MKKSQRLSLAICIVVSLVFLCAGLFIGSYKGWKSEYQALHDILAEGGSVEELLSYQGADASNLLVVAKRHLSKGIDAVKNLEQTRDALVYSSSLDARHEAYLKLSDQVKEIAVLLSASNSFQNSPRDQVYLSTLEKDLAYLGALLQASGYNQAAQDYNQRMNAAVSGKIARLLGVKPAPVFR